MGKIKFFGFIFLLLISLFFIGEIKVSNVQNVNGFLLEKYLHNPKKVIDFAKVAELDIPEYQLLIDTNDLNKIILAYDFKTESNEWETFKGKLIFQQDTFKVKISGHGDTPSNCHKKKNRVSLRIQCKKKIKGVKKFSFILFEPHGNRPKTLEIFSKQLGLIMKPSTLVKLNINSSLNWPMFIEPSTKSFCKSKELLYSKNGLLKSSIQCYELSIKEVKGRYKSDSSTIHPAFLKFLKDYNYNQSDISFFSKHFALQLILDLNGHGLTGENAVFVVDKKTENLQLLVGRDDIAGVCNTSWGNISLHYQDQIKLFVKEHGEEILFSALIKEKEFLDSSRVNLNFLIKNRDQIMEEFYEYNKMTESLYSGKFLDIHFNWRDKCELNENVFIPDVTRCLLDNNFTYWESKIQDDKFWKID
jgi:hypothetical protein